MDFAQDYTDDEEHAIASGLELLDGLGDSDAGREMAPRQSHVTLTRERIRKSSASQRLVGSCEAMIRGATPQVKPRPTPFLVSALLRVCLCAPQDITAFLMDFNSKYNEDPAHVDPKVYTRWETTEVKNDHHRVTYCEVRMTPFRSRYFLNSLLWKKVSDSPPTFIWVAVPLASHPSIATDGDTVCAAVTRCLRMTALTDQVTHVEYASSMHLGRFTDKFLLPTLTMLPYSLQLYFIKLRPSNCCTAEDGLLLGHHLMDMILKTRKNQQAAVLRTFVSQCAMLQDAPIAHVGTLLRAMIKRQFHNPKEVVHAEPTVLSDADAHAIGASVTAIYLGHNMPSKATEELLGTFAALRKASDEAPWFKAMLEAILTRMMEVSTGMLVRMTMGAALSLFDVGSDMFSIYSYFTMGWTATAAAMIMMTGLSLTGQSLVAYYRRRHLGSRVVAKEVGIVFTFLKPVADLRRLSKGYEVDGSPCSTATERSYCSGMEMVAESLPSSFLQSAVTLATGQLTGAAVASIGFSWASTAYKVYSIAFNQ
jgi:hypothetical protein